MKSVFPAFFFLMYYGTALCQTGFSVQPSLGIGKVLGQRQDFHASLYGLSLDLNRETYGKNYWQSAHKFPQTGLQLSMVKGAEEMLGTVYSVIPYIEFNIWKTGFGTLQIKHGTGLAYATQCYQTSSNSENKLLGSKLNASSIIDAGYKINWKANWRIKAGVTLGHISNGNLVQPNGGLNSITGYGMLVYYPYGHTALGPCAAVPTKPKRWRYRINAMTGLYNYDKELKVIQNTNQLSLIAFYQHSPRFRSGIGFEASRIDVKLHPVFAIYAEEEVLIGHVATRYGLGFYCSSPAEMSRLYEKIGLAWYPLKLKDQVAEKFSVGAAIKAHAFRAAHVELSVGYTL